MSTVAQTTTKLRAALDSCANEQELLNHIEDVVHDLRAIYRDRKGEFTPEIIAFLRDMTPLAEALREFVDGLQEKEWARTRDDAEELVSRFQHIAEQLDGYLVRKRVEKEIRELVAKASNLPLAAELTMDAEHRKQVARLEERAKPCTKCNGRMVLRQSQHGFFWGCSRFPLCFGKRWLSKEESALLNHDR